MCIDDRHKTGKRAAEELTELVALHLKVWVRPDELERFIRVQWPRIAVLAHHVHGSA